MKIIYYTFAISLFFACKNEQKTIVTNTGNPNIDGLSQKIAGNPTVDSLYAMRAAAYYKEQIYDAAIQDLAKAISMDTANAAYHHILADVYLDKNDSRLALRTMERVVALHPTRIPSLLKLAEFQHIVQQFKPSIETTSKILQLDAQNAEAFFMMGRNLNELGEKGRAVAAYKNCTSIDADHVDAWVELGHLMEENKDNNALQYFQTALRIDSLNTPAMFGEASYYQNRNQLEKAIEIYKKVGILEPQNADAFYNTGVLYLDGKKPKEAKDNFNICINVDPQYIMGYFYRGIASEQLGQIADAKKDYEQTLRLSPSFERAKQALAKLGK